MIAEPGPAVRAVGEGIAEACDPVRVADLFQTAQSAQIARSGSTCTVLQPLSARWPRMRKLPSFTRRRASAWFASLRWRPVKASRPASRVRKRCSASSGSLHLDRSRRTRVVGGPPAERHLPSRDGRRTGGTRRPTRRRRISSPQAMTHRTFESIMTRTFRRPTGGRWSVPATSRIALRGGPSPRSVAARRRRLTLLRIRRSSRGLMHELALADAVVDRRAARSRTGKVSPRSPGSTCARRRAAADRYRGLRVRLEGSDSRRRAPPRGSSAIDSDHRARRVPLPALRPPASAWKETRGAVKESDESEAIHFVPELAHAIPALPAMPESRTSSCCAAAESRSARSREDRRWIRGLHGGRQAARRMSKRLIAVTGGKGGIGKSVVASTLALLLARARTSASGLLDLDLTGPSDHVILGAR